MKIDRKLLSMMAVMSIFILANGQVIINPALQGISERFPEIGFSTIALLATLPNLAVAVTSLLSGLIAGKRVSYKTMVLAACILFAGAGVLPIFLSSFPALLVARTLFGVGVGIATPMGNAIVMARFEGAKRSAMVGYGSAVMCMAGVVYQTVSGFLAAINIDLMWLVHLVSILPLGLMLAFYDDERAPQTSEAKPSKLEINGKTVLLSCLFAVIFMLFYPVMLNMSAIVVGEGLGNAATAGLVQTMYTIGGAVGGVLFGRIQQRLGKATKCLTLSCVALGMALCGMAFNSALLAVGTFLCGLGVFMTSTEVLTRIGRMVSPDSLSFSTGLMMSIWNLGTFASTGFIMLVETLGGTSPRIPILIGMALVGCILVGWTVKEARPTMEK